MKNITLITTFISLSLSAVAQDKMTPELLWKLGRVESVGISKDSANVVFTVTSPNVEENTKSKKTYIIPIKGGTAKEISDSNSYVRSDTTRLVIAIGMNGKTFNQ